MSIYWPTQFSRLTWMFGGFDTARIWHFFFTAVFVAFIGGHLLMVAIAGWWNFLSIFTGWRVLPGEPPVPAHQADDAEHAEPTVEPPPQSAPDPIDTGG